jgi:hypothetical protein
VQAYECAVIEAHSGSAHSARSLVKSALNPERTSDLVHNLSP